MGQKKVARKGSLTRKFVSDEAEEKYERVVMKKRLYLEKGFSLKDTPTMGYAEPIHSVITAFNWRKFCMQPGEAIVPLVREFYANFIEEDPEVVGVRGVPVQIGSQDINRFYELEDTEDNYSALMESETDELLQEVIATICIEDTQWKISAQGAYTLPRINLKPWAKVWYHFLKSRLIPSSHNHTVSKDRAILLYCILTKKSINVGKIIHDEICNSAHKAAGHLWFSSLISELCEMSGVAYMESEEKLQPTGIITPAAVARISQENLQQAGRPAQEEADEEAGPSSRPSTSGNAAASSSVDRSAEIIQSLKMLEQRASLQEIQQYEMMQMLQQMQAQQQQMQGQQQQFWQYVQQRDLALQKHYRANSTRFHSFPAFPEELLQPPSDEAEPVPPSQAPSATKPAPSSSAQEQSSRRDTLRGSGHWKWQG